MPPALQNKLDNKRLINLRREHMHREQQDREFEQKQAEPRRLQQRGAWLRNKGGTDYDILTNDYQDSAGGRALAVKVHSHPKHVTNPSQACHEPIQVVAGATVGRSRSHDVGCRCNGRRASLYRAQVKNTPQQVPDFLTTLTHSKTQAHHTRPGRSTSARRLAQLCVTTATRHLDRLGQLSEFEQDSCVLRQDTPAAPVR